MQGTVLRVGNNEFTIDDLLIAQVPEWMYPQVGLFVAWLLTTYGPETFMALYARTTSRMTGAQVAATFVDVLGKSPEALLADYNTSAKAYYPAMGGAACGQGPVIPWQNGAATWPAEGSCEDGPFFGYDSSDWWQRVTIEVPAPGTYLFNPNGRMASLTRCLTAPADEFELPVMQSASGDWVHRYPMGDLANADEGWPDSPLELDAGIYQVWVERRRREGAGGLEMSLRKL